MPNTRFAAAIIAVGMVCSFSGYAVGRAESNKSLQRFMAGSIRNHSSSISFGSEIIPGSSGRRAYLFHGLNQGPQFWNAPPYDALTKCLIATGDEIVFVTLPHLAGNNLEGATYCTAFAKWFEATQLRLGPTRETVVIGASWGGWHAMQLGSKADRMLLFMPVTRPNRLNEFWWPKPNKCRLSRSPDSLAIYSPTDPRVGDATKLLSGVPCRRFGRSQWHSMVKSKLRH
jgi:pimeloyl-ACP methyl ester carboxylesterase